MDQIALTISGYGQINPTSVPTGAIGNKIISNLIIFAIVAAAFLALAYIIWAGINWVMSEGDKAKITQARNKITYAIIGLILIFASYFIINTVGGLFGVKLLGQ